MTDTLFDSSINTDAVAIVSGLDFIFFPSECYCWMTSHLMFSWHCMCYTHVLIVITITDYI